MTSHQMAAPGSVGAGQQTPFDGNSDVAATLFLIRQMMATMDTMKLVRVKAVTGGGGSVARAGTVDVELLVSDVDGQGNAVPAGTVYGIPWFRMQGGVGAIICDPVVGDIGYIVCADRDISGVKAAANVGNDPATTPGSFRKYNAADGVYVGGCLNGAPTQYLAFSDDGIIVRDKHGNVVQTAASGITITPAGGTVTINGNLNVTGDVVANADVPAAKVTLLAHLHTSGGAGAPTSTPTPGT